jgi:hypothetical protein
VTAAAQRIVNTSPKATKDPKKRYTYKTFLQVFFTLAFIAKNPFLTTSVLPHQHTNTTATMAQLVAKYAAKKMLAGDMNKYANKAAAGPYVSCPHIIALYIC